MMLDSRTARKADYANHEARVARAADSQQCLDQPPSRASIAVPQPSSRKYRDSGVQTLPPSNGDVFKHIHGRDPSQTDYVRNMGSAAIGRYEIGSRSNMYDPIHGPAYTIAPAVPAKVYVDSGFQTADCSKTMRALVKAKLKASVTAKKYQEVAFRAGYKVSAESKDELILHSEQHLTPVLLGADGNLLKGTVERLYLPNILGVHASDFLGNTSRTKLPEALSDSMPLRSNAPISEGTPVELFAQITALAPSSAKLEVATVPVFDEYGDAGSCSDAFVVFDAGADSTPTPPLSSSRKRKRKLNDQKIANPPSKRSRDPLQKTPKKRPTSNTRLPGQSTGSPHGLRNKLLKTPPTELEQISTASRHSQTHISYVNTGSQELNRGLKTPDIVYASRSDIHLTDERSAHNERKQSDYLNAGETFDDPPESNFSSAPSTVHDLARDTTIFAAENEYSLTRCRQHQNPSQRHAAFAQSASSISNWPSSRAPHARAREPGAWAQRSNNAINNDATRYHGAGRYKSTSNYASNFTAVDHSTMSGRVEKKSFSRCSMKFKQPIATHVPPAMRAKASQVRSKEAVRK